MEYRGSIALGSNIKLEKGVLSVTKVPNQILVCFVYWSFKERVFVFF